MHSCWQKTGDLAARRYGYPEEMEPPRCATRMIDAGEYIFEGVFDLPGKVLMPHKGYIPACNTNLKCCISLLIDQVPGRLKMGIVNYKVDRVRAQTSTRGQLLRLHSNTAEKNIARKNIP